MDNNVYNLKEKKGKITRVFYTRVLSDRVGNVHTYIYARKNFEGMLSLACTVEYGLGPRPNRNTVAGTIGPSSRVIE